MKISAIGRYLTQTEAAILVILCQKIMAETERVTGCEDENAQDANETAYAIKCTAEQSILANDGLLFHHIDSVMRSPVVQGGWLDDPNDYIKPEELQGEVMTQIPEQKQGQG